MFSAVMPFAAGKSRRGQAGFKLAGLPSPTSCANDLIVGSYCEARHPFRETTPNQDHRA